MIFTITLNPALDRELTVPEIGLDQVLRAKEIRIDFGGKGFNVRERYMPWVLRVLRLVLLVARLETR